MLRLGGKGRFESCCFGALGALGVSGFMLQIKVSHGCCKPFPLSLRADVLDVFCLHDFKPADFGMYELAVFWSFSTVI